MTATAGGRSGREVAERVLLVLASSAGSGEQHEGLAQRGGEQVQTSRGTRERALVVL